MEATHDTYAIGGWDYDDFNSRDLSYQVLKLSCPGDQIQSCQWQEMEEKLEVKSYWHGSIYVPDSSDICNWTLNKMKWNEAI